MGVVSDAKPWSGGPESNQYNLEEKALNELLRKVYQTKSNQYSNTKRRKSIGAVLFDRSIDNKEHDIFTLRLLGPIPQSIYFHLRGQDRALSVQEIADLTDYHPNTVKKYLNRMMFEIVDRHPLSPTKGRVFQMVLSSGACRWTRWRVNPDCDLDEMVRILKPRGYVQIRADLKEKHSEERAAFKKTIDRQAKVWNAISPETFRSVATIAHKAKLDFKVTLEVLRLLRRRGLAKECDYDWIRVGAFPSAESAPASDRLENSPRAQRVHKPTKIDERFRWPNQRLQPRRAR